MATGLLYDVHGNLPALEAVLADAGAAGVDRWVLGGDYASFGASPVEVVERLEALDDAVWIRGNWDRWQGGEAGDMPPQPGLAEGLAAVRERLGAECCERLGALPATHADGGTLFCHGAPKSDMDSFMPDPDGDDDARLEGVDARRVVFGHTHLAFTREHAGVTLVNPGSVGMPFDGDVRAAWAVLHDDGRLEQRRVDYDMDAAIGALTDRYGDEAWVRGTIDRLRAASFFV
jgi:diadenosine tetraphosphatase ApaH/serine/threonine PP2A family protein phosphatase